MIWSSLAISSGASPAGRHNSCRLHAEQAARSVWGIMGITAIMFLPSVMLRRASLPVCKGVPHCFSNPAKP
jgi:hypothetical protein